MDAPTEANQPLAQSSRQLNVLANDMAITQPRAFWERLQHVSHLQLDAIAKALEEICVIEKQLRSMPMTIDAREKALGNLNRLGAWLESKADFANLINSKAHAVVIADHNTDLAQKHLQIRNAEAFLEARDA